MPSLLDHWNSIFHPALVRALHPTPALYVKSRDTTWWSPAPEKVIDVRIISVHGLPRISLGYFKQSIPPQLRTRLGWATRPTDSVHLGIELTVQESELAAFAAWLPGFTRARVQGTEVPAPPHLLSPEHHTLAQIRYGWSASADEAAKKMYAARAARKNTAVRAVVGAPGSVPEKAP